MKQTRNMVNCLVACAIALAMVPNLTAQTVKERVAKVVRVKGAARFSPGNNVWQPVEPGTRLKAGSVIQTAADSFVDIVLDEGGAVPFTIRQETASRTAGISYRPTVDQDVIRVYADSFLVIEKLTRIDTGGGQVTETQLDLKSGKIYGSVKKLAAASVYEVKIPNGVAGIRGTSFIISADGIVSVFTGSVVIAYTGPDGNPVTQVVGAGQQFNSRTGEVAPISQPPPGDVGFAPIATPTTFVKDHTIYVVSPTTEDSGG